jgi:predicted Zn finger-like uncharacterized protein
MMQTRCPACHTVFRVTPLQLKAKQGKVRCGQCRHVFDALASLIDAEPSPGDEQTELLPNTPIISMVEPPEVDPLEDIPETVAPSLYRPGLEIPPEPLLHEEAKAKSRTWIWVLCTLLALAVLLLQAVVQFRTGLSVLIPEAKPALQETCALLGCDLTLPHKPDLLGIEASDLHPNPGGLLILAATLKNRATFAQAYPDLELTLTNNSDQPLIRKVIPPQEYLPKTVDVAAGFAANSEIALNLTLDAGSSGATGYRIYLFYP